MLVLFTVCLPSTEEKEEIRAEVKERTGEDCLILGPIYRNVLHFNVKKEREAPRQKRLPWQFTFRSRHDPRPH